MKIDKDHNSQFRGLFSMRAVRTLSGLLGYIQNDVTIFSVKGQCMTLLGLVKYNTADDSLTMTDMFYGFAGNIQELSRYVTK